MRPAQIILAGAASALLWTGANGNPSLLGAEIEHWVAFATLAIYLASSYCDGSEYTVEGRAWPWFQKSWLLKALFGPQGYFKGQVICEDEEALKEVKQGIIAAFPHGIASFHHVMLCSDACGFLTKFPTLGYKRRDLAASAALGIPIFREMLLWMGCVDAGRSTAKAVLQRGYSMYVLPGGEREQVLTQCGRHIVYLKNRKGFVKLALQYGADLIPNYSFGETDMYTTSSFLSGLRLAVCKHLRVALPICWGVALTPIPRPVPLIAVVGKPIKVEKKVEPTNEDVDELHAKFVKALQELFDNHKANHDGYANAKLEIH
ncbi:hypothetical protein CYMTET_5569 [Cymbomonas tetramitiformis]|uniref:Acyltransferase n=1 Tax=Cymbomonas tetramitiformis TaxID=36881 RepID=A0AAE0GZ89_9CHLO|nr:hypothetical protein CYMTET_5569 [Cymbomonas tetramitiformis]